MTDQSTHHLSRVRAICATLPEITERLSHGEPAFFVGRRACVLFADHHHNDPRIAVWLPVPPGAQAALIEAEPAAFFRPPYVWMHGWVGIDLGAIGDDELREHIEVAWGLVAPRRLAGR